MALIERIRVSLTGFVGGPGVCTFYAVSGASAQAPLIALWDDLRNSMPNSVTIQVASSGDVINDATGALSGAWAGSTSSALVGTSSSSYAGGVGLQLTWLTATILDGHRIKGRTFVVPIASGVFDTDGTLTPAQVAGRTTAAQNYVHAVSGNALIWHRPRLARPAVGARPALPARAGASCEVTDAAVPDRSALLRSRRD